MKLQKILLGLMAMGCYYFSIAQTAIGTTTPAPSAKFEVASTNKGFLPPRIALTSVSDVTTIPSPATGLMVFCTGTGGLTAGYYFWNGASWATIATNAGAGNVAAANMVKLYSEAYSTSSGKLNHANGYAFTVPVTGRYQFDFAATAYVFNAYHTLTFAVRNASNTVLASDTQTSVNNNVHVEYKAQFEVDLIAGTNYNVYVSTNGSRDASDFDRVWYKQVSGNLAIATPFAVNLGGTGATTAAAGLNNLLPSQSSQNNRVLTSDGNNATWKSKGTIGDIQTSLLTLAQFQALNGSGWVLLNGADITGSDLAVLTGMTSLPDARGQFLRGKNNGRSDGKENPDGDVAIGTYQADEIKSHTHTINNGDVVRRNVPGPNFGGGSDGYGTPSTLTNNNTGGNETRPKNITVNYFIKINH